MVERSRIVQESSASAKPAEDIDSGGVDSRSAREVPVGREGPDGHTGETGRNAAGCTMGSVWS